MKLIQYLKILVENWFYFSTMNRIKSSKILVFLIQNSSGQFKKKRISQLFHLGIVISDKIATILRP